MTYFHAVVWLDHQKSLVIQFGPEESEATELTHALHKPRYGYGARGHEHLHAEPAFYKDVAERLAGVCEILVTGPGEAKTEFVKYLKDHQPALAGCVRAVETSDHPSEGQLLAHGRAFFRMQDCVFAS